MRLYKAQVLSYLESSTPGLLHAAPSVLDKVDRVQRRLWRELGLTELQGLLDFRLAPLPARRSMSMLGLLHKIALGEAPLQLAELFPLRGAVAEGRRAARLGNNRPLHDKQLAVPPVARPTEQFRRSLFGVADVYNLLPQKAVDCVDVKTFQRTLQQALKVHATKAGAPVDWQLLFTTGWRALTRRELDELFT